MTPSEQTERQRKWGEGEGEKRESREKRELWIFRAEHTRSSLYRLSLTRFVQTESTLKPLK